MREKQENKIVYGHYRLCPAGLADAGRQIVAQTVENCVNAGCIPPIYVSSNLDKGDAINAQHIKNYSKLISCL